MHTKPGAEIPEVVRKEWVRERICVNALAGVADPAEMMRAVDELLAVQKELYMGTYDELEEWIGKVNDKFDRLRTARGAGK